MWDYEAYISNFPNLAIVTLDSALARQTAIVRATTSMRMPDAVQVAAAVLYTADMIVTNDRAWLGKLKRAESPGAPPWPAVLYLDDHAA